MPKVPEKRTDEPSHRIECVGGLIKERPRCRETIEQRCREYGTDVVGLAAAYRARRVILSDGMLKQLRKMVAEYRRKRAAAGGVR
jgi:hypothetical protein